MGDPDAGLVRRMALAVYSFNMGYPVDTWTGVKPWHRAHAEETAEAAIAVMQPEIARLTAERDALREALNIIRHTWAGHSEECRSYHIPGGKCDCDWPEIAAKCDAALSAKEDESHDLS